ncbi:MAG: nicotinate phosphoribosyltransferase, partial [Acholeplasmataceae bacterium]|nr:nicotinate phosphoribosyltransferase [Acholeplasmataceae bacterium]
KEGLTDCKITVSNSLDEYLIRELIRQGACIDSFGVGERLITSKSDSVFGGVYKLGALKENGVWIPKMKLSDNVEKTTIPGIKGLYRFFKDGKAIADVVTLKEEIIDENKPYLLFDPDFPWKNKLVEDFKAVNLLEPIFIDGKQVYKSPNLDEIRNYHKKQMSMLWDELKRFDYPHQYYVDLSKPLWDIREKLLKEFSKDF